ncbi:MAG: hypothetical protein ISS63_16490 [Desulfobacteraceae bacterium]|nr:hypothetical protein [Desulfobacteraceae bacterium]
MSPELALGFIPLIQDGKHILYNEALGVCAILDKGATLNEYTPPLHPYDWPLSLGKSWKATGVMKTSTGSLNLATCYEVKGYGRVRVPAGIFNAFYIIGKNDTGRVRIVELWYSPEIKNYVKGISYLISGKVTEELVDYSNIDVDSAQKVDEIEKKLEKLRDLLNKG